VCLCACTCVCSIGKQGLVFIFKGGRKTASTGHVAGLFLVRGAQCRAGSCGACTGVPAGRVLGCLWRSACDEGIWGEVLMPMERNKDFLSSVRSDSFPPSFSI